VSITRRDLLARGSLGLGLLATGNLSALLRAPSAAAAPRGGRGPLVTDPAGLLDLPDGFRYQVVSRAGDALPGGGVVPSNQDGTAAFRGPGGGTRLVINHELGATATHAAVADPDLTYDPKAKGGTTTLTLDRRNRRVDEHVSLAGTWSNCAGGPTPWGTWLTCEETEQRAGATADRDHGFVFEVDPATPRNNRQPTPLTGMGRFAHEAAAIDPRTGNVYLTEDANGPHGLVYRFTPRDVSREYGALRDGGTLAAMACAQRGTHVPDLCVFDRPGTTLDVSWVPVPDPLATTVSTRKQLADTEVTRSRKLEGAWYADGRVYIVCSFARTADGSPVEHDGQVWSYDPHWRRLRLEVCFGVNPDPTVEGHPDGPDNITVSPFGELFLCEDGEGLQHLYVVDDDGTAAPFARNRLNDSELTGVCFSPDARKLFVNIQDPGITFAVTGPFQARRGD
jgi:secreted PhoX family phosphatase